MNISNNYNNYNKNTFKAVRMSPHAEKWDQQVLGAVLNSSVIRKIVKEDAKNGKDTFITFTKNIDPPMPECPAHRDYMLSIKGEKNDIELGSHSTYWFVPGGFFRKPQEIKTGPENLGEDMAKQIQRLESKDAVKPHKYHTLDDLKKIAKQIIFEPEKPYMLD